MAPWKIKYTSAFYALVVFQLIIFGSLKFLGLPSQLIRLIVDPLLYFAVIYHFFKKTKIKKDLLLGLFFLLFIVYCVSFVLNKNDIGPMIKEIRFTFIGAAVYSILMNYNFSRQFFDKIIRFVFFVGYIQFPIVLFQRLFYNFLKPLYGAKLPHFVDFPSGTIGFSETGILGVFLVLLCIVKFQELMTYGYKLKVFLQLILLLAPIAFINSDVQFAFIPAIIVFAALINIRTPKQLFVYIVTGGFVLLLVNLLLFVMSERTIPTFFAKAYEYNTSTPNYGLQEQGRILRGGSMYWVFMEALEKPSLFGKGPGYWLERDSDGKKSITKIWYHGNALLLYYGEAGLCGLVLILLVVITMFIQTDNSFWGKVIRLETMYVFLVLFYQFPFSHLGLACTLMVFLAYYRRFERTKKSLITSNSISRISFAI